MRRILHIGKRILKGKVGEKVIHFYDEHFIEWGSSWWCPSNYSDNSVSKTGRMVPSTALCVSKCRMTGFGQRR